MTVSLYCLQNKVKTPEVPGRLQTTLHPFPYTCPWLWAGGHSVSPSTQGTHLLTSRPLCSLLSSQHCLTICAASFPTVGHPMEWQCCCGLLTPPTRHLTPRIRHYFSLPEPPFPDPYTKPRCSVYMLRSQAGRPSSALSSMPNSAQHRPDPRRLLSRLLTGSPVIFIVAYLLA